MALAADFEGAVNQFIHSKTGEKIYLDLSQDKIVILRPICGRGSTSLGAFWVKLMQHPNNFPVYAYLYKKLYQAGQMFQLQLRIDGLNIILDLTIGYMIIKGAHAIDWFVNKFPEIMKGYSSPPQYALETLKKSYDKEQALAMISERERAYRNFLEKWPLSALEKGVNISQAGKNGGENYEPISQDGFLLGDDLETQSPTPDLLNESDTSDQLERLTKGRVIQGCVLYRLWKSTLRKWFSDSNGKVFIVTSHIDSDRLADICGLFLDNKLTACIDTICMPLHSLYDSFAEVRRNTINRFSARDQVTIEYKIYSAIVHPVKDFTTSFIAMVKEGVVYILQTNTDFDRYNFITTRYATVEYLQLNEATFHQNYLDPIL